MSPRFPKAAIFGCAGLCLSEEEKTFFKAANPLGFILFARNCQSPDQISELVDELRACVGHDHAPVLIDQEGGRVQRMGSPNWPVYPPQAAFAELARRNADVALWAARENAAAIAVDLIKLGIDVNCLPLLDVNTPDGHDVIGDRAYGDDPALVAALGESVMQGLLSQGVTPIVKHIPGHGRARVDSHLELPTVETQHGVLSKTDFQPFKALRTAPWAMTAHVVYADIDRANPATLSMKLISEVIRGEIGFQGLLVTDDMSMKALSGSIGENSAMALESGCDVVLHCNGDISEMIEIDAAVSDMSDAAWGRFQAGREQVRKAKHPSSVPNMDEVRRHLASI